MLTSADNEGFDEDDDEESGEEDEVPYSPPTILRSDASYDDVLASY
jgi:hypothetical protein